MLFKKDDRSREKVITANGDSPDYPFRITVEKGSDGEFHRLTDYIQTLESKIMSFKKEDAIEIEKGLATRIPFLNLEAIRFVVISNSWFRGIKIIGYDDFSYDLTYKTKELFDKDLAKIEKLGLKVRR